MAVFGEDAIKESTKISIEVNNHGFVIRGRRILEEGWLNYYKPYVRIKEQPFTAHQKRRQNLGT